MTDSLVTGQETAGKSTGIEYGESQLYETYLSHLVNWRTLVWTNASTITTLTGDLFETYYDTAITTQLNKLSSFSYFSGNLKVTIAVQGAPYAYGQYVVCFLPYVTYPGTLPFTASHTTFGPEKTRSKILPHIVIDPSKSETYEIELKCPTPGGLWYRESLNFGYGSYVVKGIPFNSLQSGTASVPTINMTMYFSMTNPRTGALRLSSGLVTEEQEKNALSDTVSAVSAGAAALSSVPTLGPFATALSNVTGKAAQIMKLLGFSKPIEMMQEHPVLNRVFNNYSHINGKSYAFNLGTDENNTIGVSDSYQGIGKSSDMLIEGLMRRPGLIYQFDVLQTAASGARLAGLPVRPFEAFLLNAGDRYEMTPLHHMTAPYQYWHGEITFTIEIVASVFHRATLLVVYSPDQDLGALDYENAMTGLYTRIVHVSGNTSIDFTVPWRSWKPWLLNSPIPKSATFDSNTDNGMLCFFLVNPVVANGSTDGLEINVYHSSDNMKVMGPNLPTDNQVQLKLASGMVDVTTDMAQTAPENDYYLKFGGENLLTSTKKIASKMSILYPNCPISADGKTFPLYPMFPATENYVDNTETPLTDTYPVRWTWYNWYAFGYLGVRGSINISAAEIIPLLTAERPHAGILAYTDVPGADAFAVTSESAYTMKYGSFAYSYDPIHPAVDVCHPHYYPGLFRPNFPVPSMQELKESVAISPYGEVSGTEDVNVAVLHGLGDDATFVWYIGCPVVEFGGV